MAWAVQDGRIGSDHPDFRQGQLFLLNKVQGMTLRPNTRTLEGLKAYEDQPVEKHAKEVSDELGKLIPFRQ